jgi:hypothetical protein
MKNYKFPRTYADLDAAPWCDFYERPGYESIDQEKDLCFIHVHTDWFPADYGERTSANGYTLKEALIDLQELWDDDMRPPEEVKA